MASSYANVFILICVSITAAAIVPSAATLARTVNLNGTLICAVTGTPAAPNVTVSLVCVSRFSGIRVVLEATTTATGTISASTNVGLVTRTAVSARECVVIAPPQICPGTVPANTVLGASVTTSTSLRTITVTTSSPLGPLPR